ncbi:MAG: glycosyltransferase family 4 protein [Candidatus Helarchaeota archaeon]|nr:glycosyltransferase family 4 protein [Candidatus Helarchaeota archaeon]
MNFLFILPTFYPNIGGVETATLEICRQLQKRSHKVYVLTTNKSNYFPTNKRLNASENYKGIPIYRTRSAIRYLGIPLKAFFLIRKFRINQLYITDFSGFIAIFFKKVYRIPFTYALNGYNPICPKGTLLRSEKCQGFEVTKCLKYCHKFSLRFFLMFIITRALLFEARPVIANSNAVKNAFISYFGAFPMKLIYYGIDLQKFYPKNVRREGLPYDLKESDNIILFFGRVIKERGLFEFLPHFKALLLKIQCKLLIVGFGPEILRIRARVLELKLQNHVVFPGILTNQELINVINLSDIVILPILFPEPLSLVVLEAMACAKPVISFELGGVQELLQGIEPKLLILPKDWEQFADKIVELLNKRELRTSIGLALRQKAETTFTWDQYINQFLKAINHME